MGTNLWIALWLLHTIVADLIVVEPEGADPALTRVIVESYRGAVGDVDTREDGSQTLWYARVTWDETRLHARIEIRRGSPDAGVESLREVDFSATDDIAQRHRAVGLIIAAHVVAGAHVRPATPDTGKSPAVPTKPAPGQPEDGAELVAAAEGASEAVRLPALGVDLALLAGPALDRGAPRFGLMLRGFARPSNWPIAGVVSVGAARRFQAPELMLWSASAGLALRLQPRASAFALEARGEAVVQRTEVQAQGSAPDRSESGGAWRAGGQLGLEGHARVASAVSLFVGAQLRLLQPAVHVEVAGREVGVEPALGWDALAGVRYAR